VKAAVAQIKKRIAPESPEPKQTKLA